MPVIPALRRPRQENYCKFEVLSAKIIVLRHEIQNTQMKLKLVYCHYILYKQIGQTSLAGPYWENEGPLLFGACPMVAHFELPAGQEL